MSNESKHTPGPWRLDPTHDAMYGTQYSVYGPPHPIDGGNYSPICTVRDPDHAALIARAPDLLAENERLRAALEKVLSDVPCDGLDEWEVQARAALAKVTP